MAHRQTGTQPIAPRGAGNGREKLFGLEPADVPQRIFEHALLGGGLPGKIEVLHGTAAAGAEVRARRRHALAGRTQHAQGAGLLVVRLPAIAFVFDDFSRQRAFDENRLAVHVRDAASFVIQGFDICKRHGVCGARSTKGGDYNRPMIPGRASQVPT